MLSAWIDRQRSDRRLQAAVAVLGLALLACFLVGAFRKAYRPIGYDIHCFLTTAQAVRAGANPYLVPMPIPYNYPLLACTAAVPLTFLPEAVVHAGWFLASLAALAGAAFLLVGRLARSRGGAGNRGLLLPLACACLLLLGAIQNHLLNGQTDAFVLLLCVRFWIDWQEGRGSRAAFWLGLGVSLKLVPALFFVPLALNRSWSVLARTCAWVAALSVALPMLFLGTGVFTAYEQFFQNVVMAELYQAAHSEQFRHCFTVHGALTWLVPICKTSLAARAGAALLVLLPLWVMERRGDGSSPWRHFGRLEAYLAGILLLAPLSQQHHLVLLLPLAWLLVLRWLTRPGRSLWVESRELLPYGLFPLWNLLGGPLETLAVGWLFVGAVGRAIGFTWEELAQQPLGLVSTSWWRRLGHCAMVTGGLLRPILPFSWYASGGMKPAG